MSRGARDKLVVWVAAGAGIVAVAITVFMIGDQVRAMVRANGEAAQIAELQERVQNDAGAAAELEAERDRQTKVSVAREARDQRLGVVLLAAAAIFLSAAKLRKPSTPLPPVGERGHGAEPLVSISSLPSGNGNRGVAVPGGPDLAYVDTVITRLGRGKEAAIPILQALQTHYRYLPEEALRRLTERTEITPAQIAGVASFYARFRRRPMGRHLVRVCHGTACHVAGVGPIMDELRRRLGIPEGEDTDPGRRFTLDPVACLGCCSLAPVMMVGEEVAGRLTPLSATATLATVESYGTAEETA